MQQSPNGKENDSIKVNVVVVDDKKMSQSMESHKLDFSNVIDYETRNVAPNDPRESL